ncbi:MULTISPECIES: ArsR/SmtB family transcription factor [unclassified Brevibacterium]|jgi:DNA-binding transcriptional ArsR family regulator|uniref:ArsR/SmtB family transcription factor n=1 Tax=unclassified Brevibacterium TaxID=2614124 RepID=UPI0010803A50|nr:metalloregulator ArsR/SmtB family transcription factor [Brevibacterium sp. S111]TGD13615.1 ArsR family transcriptional regulator [Brevibacterium sp. S111]
MTLDLVFGALADPTRRAIIDRLRDGDLSSGELADPLPISRSAVSQHLKVLESAGLITRSKSAQRRIVSLNVDRLSAATGWLQAAHDEWQQRFDNLDQVLAADQQAETS